MKTDRKFELILYPDSISYDCDQVLIKAQKYFTYWAYILHDSDLNEDGTPKKAHYHFYGKSDCNLTPSSICYMLGITEVSLANIKNWKSAIRYLIHLDHPAKHPYLAENIVSNFDIKQYLNASDDDDMQAAKIFNYIKENYGHLSYPALTEWVIENHLWSAYRRGFAVWSKLLNGGS